MRQLARTAADVGTRLLEGLGDPPVCTGPPGGTQLLVEGALDQGVGEHVAGPVHRALRGPTPPAPQSP